LSNFGFLKTEWSEIYNLASEAERFIYTAPVFACLNNRKALENAVKWLYKNEKYLKLPYEVTLNSLIHEQTFRENLEPALFQKIRLIQKLGNLAAHESKQLNANDALHSAQELFHFLYWLYRYYSTPPVEKGLVFNPELISQKTEDQIEIERLKAELAQKHEEILSKESLLKENQEILAQIQLTKTKNKQIPDNYDYSEEQTRDNFIDVLLKEAGWDISAKNATEYKVFGMPNDKGEGYVDCVLWGDDGKPLGIVEAKRTRKNPKIGERQAELYADCLQKQFDQRPIIFISNGYEHYLWDDVNYPRRQVQGFYKKDELQLMINRRESRKSLNSIVINKEITERPYQEEAIKRVCEELENKKRKALLVMATGTGKTRPIISLVDILLKNNWAKRVLFLADRTALVTQAQRAFKKFLPETNPVDITKQKDQTLNRVVLSTYHTMMNLIDSTKGESKIFGAGHFDLIIIDEAHRSVYQKFKTIFDYFDSYLLGLTATPRSEVDRNTYDLFELEDEVPTYYYEYEDAVKQGYLVDYSTFKGGTKFLSEGVKYSELSDEEKDEYETLFYDEESDMLPPWIDPAKLNKYLFNKDTVDIVLEQLMQNGIKVQGGDKLGKTIIFAKNQDHAEFIKERFDKNYQNLGGQFARVIHNKVNYVQSLIDDFSIKEKEPTITISVDMLDTGIDVPEVVNLVFFKIIRSKTKFYQMIGRGTRLCEDLFGPSEDKEGFYIFDFCNNFEFFEANPNGKEPKLQMPLSQKIFVKRLELSQQLKDKDKTMALLSNKLKDMLHSEVKSMDTDNFIVRPHKKEVEIYSNREAWDNLSDLDLIKITKKISNLPSQSQQDNELAKRFDLLVLNMQFALLENSKYIERYQVKMKEIADGLELKKSIPTVNAQLELILDMQTDEFWETITIPELETIRIKLRNLIELMDTDDKKVVYSDFEDNFTGGTFKPNNNSSSFDDTTQYKKKVEHFLNAHKDHITINKLRFNKPITALDIQELNKILIESGTIDDEEKIKELSGDMDLGVFLRKIVGLDRKAAEEVFASYLKDNDLNPNQLRFINQIIDYLTIRGVMEPDLLYEPPFTDIHCDGVEGLFADDSIDDLIHLIKEINQNAQIMVAR